MFRYRQEPKIRDRSDLPWRSAYSGPHGCLGLPTVSAFFTKISNSLLINFTSSDMIAVVTDANHENMFLFIVLWGLRFLEEDDDDDFRFVMLALLALRCLRGGLREPALFLLRLPPRNFLIILCVVSVACWDSMWPVCEGLSAISVMIFPPVLNALRSRDLVLLHSTGRTVLHSPRS